MSEHKGDFARKRRIDGEEAQRLFDLMGSWRAVADAMKADSGPAYTIGALASAAWTWRKAAGVSSRFARAEYDSRNLDGLGTWWRPVAPKALKVVPDYRSDTVRPA